MKLAILSLAVCLMAFGQSIHVHPNGRELVFQLGTNTVTTDQRKCLSRIRQFERDIVGLRDQIAFAQKCLQENPHRIEIMEQEIATQKLYLEMMRVMNVTNLPSAPITPPPMPPGLAPLPVNASVQNGLPPGFRPQLAVDVKTAR